MRKATSIQKLEQKFDERAARFLWQHPFLGFLAVFIGAPSLVLLCVCAGTALIVLPVGWLLGQQYTDDAHLWGRIMNLDVSTFRDENGKSLLYAAPSNLSPASEEYASLVAQRIEKLRAADPDMDGAAIPVDLVTCSGSGLDPHISPAAAEYQVPRIAQARDMTEDQVRKVIAACTQGRLLGLLGEETVNVLEVNLMLDGILTK